MFARLTIIKVKIDKIDEAIKLYDKSVVPAARTQKGYCGAYLLTDRKTGRGVAITFWDCEGDALANEENRYYQEQVVKFLDFFVAPPVREGYDVSVKA